MLSLGRGSPCQCCIPAFLLENLKSGCWGSLAAAERKNGGNHREEWGCSVGQGLVQTALKFTEEFCLFFSCNSGVLVSVEAVSKTTLYIRTVLCLKDRHFLI